MDYKSIMADKMTPEERAEDVSNAGRIAQAIRDAIKEEREACAALCEAEAGDITIARISAASSTYEHESMRREAAILKYVAQKIRERTLD